MGRERNFCSNPSDTPTYQPMIARNRQIRQSSLQPLRRARSQRPIFRHSSISFPGWDPPQARWEKKTPFPLESAQKNCIIQKLPTPFGNLHAVKAGRGPRILLVADKPGPIWLFYTLIGELTAFPCEIFTFEFPGDGYSSASDLFDFTLDANVSCLGMVTAKFQPTVVVGFGLGFHLLTHLAFVAPDLVSGVGGFISLHGYSAGISPFPMNLSAMEFEMAFENILTGQEAVQSYLGPSPRKGGSPYFRRGLSDLTDANRSVRLASEFAAPYVRMTPVQITGVHRHMRLRYQIATRSMEYYTRWSEARKNLQGKHFLLLAGENDCFTESEGMSATTYAAELRHALVRLLGPAAHVAIKVGPDWNHFDIVYNPCAAYYARAIAGFMDSVYLSDPA